MTGTNLQIKDRFFQAVMAGDTDTMRALLAPGFELHQPPGLAHSGSYAGVDGFLSFLQKYMAAYEIEALDNTDTFLSNNPDRIVLEFRLRGRSKATGEQLDTRNLECWEFQAGRIQRIVVYWFATPRAA